MLSSEGMFLSASTHVEAETSQRPSFIRRRITSSIAGSYSSTMR